MAHILLFTFKIPSNAISTKPKSGTEYCIMPFSLFLIQSLKRDKIVRENKEFAFTKLFTCGYCGSGISAEEKYKQLKDGTHARYIYYSCSRARDRHCKNKYIREEELITELLKIIRITSYNVCYTKLLRDGNNF